MLDRAWSRRGFLASVATALGAAACGRVMTVFPPGLMPLEATNMAPTPTPQGADMYPETLSVVHGQVVDQYYWVHAKGFVKANMVKTWEAIRTPDACVDRRAVSEWMTTQNVEPAYRYSFRVHNIVRAAITLEFDNTWRHDVAGGPVDNPETTIGAWQKTDGSDIISLLRGSIVATRVTDSVTSIEMIEHLQSFSSDHMPAEAFLRDYYASILALTKGQSLPTYP